MWTSSQPQRNLSKFSAQTIDEEFFGTSPTWIEQFEWELSNKYDNPFLLILNVPLILKTGIHLQFPKISVWPI